MDSLRSRYTSRGIWGRPNLHRREQQEHIIGPTRLEACLATIEELRNESEATPERETSMRLKALSALALCGALACLVFASVGGATVVKRGSAATNCGGHPALLFGSHMPFPLSLFISGNANVDIYLGKLHSRNGHELVLSVSKTLCSSTGDVDSVALPADTQVRRNGASADVRDLRLGDVVAVILSRHGDYVLAGSAAFAGPIAARIKS
jgi:hypothetical protein